MPLDDKQIFAALMYLYKIISNKVDFGEIELTFILELQDNRSFYTLQITDTIGREANKYSDKIDFLILLSNI